MRQARGVRRPADSFPARPRQLVSLRPTCCSDWFVSSDRWISGTCGALPGSSPAGRCAGSSPVSGLRVSFAGSEGAWRRLRGLKPYFRFAERMGPPQSRARAGSGRVRGQALFSGLRVSFAGSEGACRRLRGLKPYFRFAERMGPPQSRDPGNVDRPKVPAMAGADEGQKSTTRWHNLAN